MEAKRDDYTISTDPARFDLDVIHGYLSRSYWAEGISRELIARSIANSLCFGIYTGETQVGFARVITDKTTFGDRADVFVLDEYRRRGLSKWLMELIMAHPDLQGFRRWLLATRSAHGLYEKFGFNRLAHPENMMEIVHQGLYAGDRRTKSGGRKAAD